MEKNQDPARALQNRLADAEADIARILKRLDALEQRPSGDAGMSSPRAWVRVETASLGAQEAPPALSPESGRDQPGTLGYSGQATFGQRRYSAKRRVPLLAAFSPDPESIARMFSAMASPHRIVILRALCQESLSGQQLQELVGFSSPGQLHHHLKELMAVDLVVQQGRSRYSIHPARVVATCVAFALASDIVSGYESQGTLVGPENPATTPPPQTDLS